MLLARRRLAIRIREYGLFRTEIPLLVELDPVYSVTCRTLCRSDVYNKCTASAKSSSDEH